MDADFLLETLNLAKVRKGFCAPNPSVGALVVKKDVIISIGYHLEAGSPHAEVEAIQNSPTSVEGSTLYVSLEPCCIWGRTPPCTRLLIENKVAKVIYGFRDPNPDVSGKGEGELLSAGIECQRLALTQIERFYSSYAHWVKTAKPTVTAKLAMTLNGKIAGPRGERLSISGEALQIFTHEQRKISDAILTTAKTILNDDPQLNVRLGEENFAKPVYVLDRKLKFPLNAQVLKTSTRVTLFHEPEADKDRLSALSARGVRCVPIETSSGFLNLEQVLSLIGKDGIHDLWLEAGGRCFFEFASQGLLKRAFLYVAPKWVMSEATPAFDERGASVFKGVQDIQWSSVGSDALCEMVW